MNEPKTSAAQLRAAQKYKQKNKPNIKRFTVDFGPHDHDLHAHLSSKPNKQAYIRELIRADMERGGENAAD